MPLFQLSVLDVCLAALGLVLLLLDVVLDVLAALDLWGDVPRVALLLLLLCGSSVLVQTYSWLWYQYDAFARVTRVERSASVRALGVLHLLQLGVYLRYLGVLEMAACKYLALKGRGADPGDRAVYLSHDVALLRIVETFSESLPQLVLMLATVIQRQQLHFFPVLKAVGAASGVSFTVMSYHRTLRSFLKDKRQQSLASSLVYFLWNFLLIAARVTALALFASELPCYVGVHFLCSWAGLFVCAWCCQTDFMDGPGGEVLYRATVALVWYFNWFDVVEGRVLQRAVLYHGYILADITLLCGLWFWKTNPDITNFSSERLVAFVCVLFIYMVGLFLCSVYHHCFHPNVTKHDLKCEEATELEPATRVADEVDHHIEFRCMIEDTPTRITSEHGKKMNKRMRNLAGNFYS